MSKPLIYDLQPNSNVLYSVFAKSIHHIFNNIYIDYKMVYLEVNLETRWLWIYLKIFCNILDFAVSKIYSSWFTYHPRYRVLYHTHAMSLPKVNRYQNNVFNNLTTISMYDIIKFTLIWFKNVCPGLFYAGAISVFVWVCVWMYPQFSICFCRNMVSNDYMESLLNHSFVNKKK